MINAGTKYRSIRLTIEQRETSEWTEKQDGGAEDGERALFSTALIRTWIHY